MAGEPWSEHGLQPAWTWPASPCAGQGSLIGASAPLQLHRSGGGVCCPLPWPRKAGGWGSTELDAAARVGRSHLEATWGMWLSQDLLWSPKSRKSRHLSGRWVPGAVGAANRGEQDPTAWMWACTSTDSTHHPGSQPHQVNYFLEMTAFINIEKKKKNHFL